MNRAKSESRESRRSYSVTIHFSLENNHHPSSQAPLPGPPSQEAVQLASSVCQGLRYYRTVGDPWGGSFRAWLVKMCSWMPLHNLLMQTLTTVLGSLMGKRKPTPSSQPQHQHWSIHYSRMGSGVSAVWSIVCWSCDFVNYYLTFIQSLKRRKEMYCYISSSLCQGQIVLL